MRYILLGLLAIVILATIVAQLPRLTRLSSIERWVAAEDQTANAEVEFFGVVVDQCGLPLKDAVVNILVRGINTDWANDTRRANSRGQETELSLKTNAEGEFTVKVTGTGLGVKSIDFPGYRWLFETSTSVEAGGNSWYRLAPKGFAYEPRIASPATFVMIRDGLRVANVMPSRGGADIDGRGQLHTNKPRWPAQPSVSDVRYQASSTRASDGS